MLFHLQSAVIGLILAGAAIMGLAILKTRQLTTWLNRENDSVSSSDIAVSEQRFQSWKVLSALMTFFLLGYCLAVALVFYNQSDWLTVLVGIVFFFGALFVLFSIRVYAITLRQLMASQAMWRAETKRATEALEMLKQVQHEQVQTIHTEKMHSLGQMSAGIAHEINNPVGFIHSNLSHVRTYALGLFSLINAYEQQSTESSVAQIAEDIELDFIRTDLLKIIDSMKLGSDRIRAIVKSMRNFSRLDESKRKSANLIEGIESTLVMLQGKLNDSDTDIKIITQYDPQLPPVHCNHSAINQVFLQILSNAIEAFTPSVNFSGAAPTIKIVTQQLDNHWAQITISDNGNGIGDENMGYIFDPFFTTKPIGKGTGLGLSVSHQIIVEQHRGQLMCSSQPKKGTTLTIRLPIDAAI